jgi:hypothetical protein
MTELVVRTPDVDAFLALAPEELATKMLFLMRERNQVDFHRDSLENELSAQSARRGRVIRVTGASRSTLPSRHGHGPIRDICTESWPPLRICRVQASHSPRPLAARITALGSM